MLVFEAYGNYERHSVYLVLRGKTSAAELYETEADLYVARQGASSQTTTWLVDSRGLPA